MAIGQAESTADIKDAPPALVPVEELPVYGVKPADRKWVIDQLTRELDAGQFVNASRQADAMLRDARILGAMEQRLAGLFAAPLELQPGGPPLKPTATAGRRPQAVRVRDEVKELWPKMFPRDTLEEIQQYAIMNGISISSKMWDPVEKPWKLILQPIHPQFYLWRWDTLSYWVLTRNEGLVNTSLEPKRWFIFTPYGYRRAYLRGRVRALMDPFMMRGWDKSDWANYNEVHGKPVRKAIVPQMADPKQEQKFVDAVSKMGSNTAVKTRQDKDGNKYDIELVEAKSNSWQTFQSMLKWCDGEISNVLLGQAMSTDGVGGLGATEKPGDSVRQDIKASDNEKLCEALYGLLREYCLVNHGNEELAPRPNYQVAPPEDESKLATTDQSIGSALVSFKTAGAPINVREFLAERSYPLLTEDEEKAQKAQAIEDARANMEATTPTDEGPPPKDKAPSGAEKLKAATDAMVQFRLAGIDADPGDVMKAVGLDSLKTTKAVD